MVHGHWLGSAHRLFKKLKFKEVLKLKGSSKIKVACVSSKSLQKKKTETSLGSKRQEKNNF